MPGLLAGKNKFGNFQVSLRSTVENSLLKNITFYCINFIENKYKILFHSHIKL